ncbi:MAG: SBBP repeat-containing protein [Scytonema sp. PMC 1069.18]|nr:SBBP repeat-containing protein [Scytonema sp. PMC 1069.18]MEC4882104.1 SBBP repeat-containing protein [Scytonema sp. PMC 1070.18]
MKKHLVAKAVFNISTALLVLGSVGIKPASAIQIDFSDSSGNVNSTFYEIPSDFLNKVPVPVIRGLGLNDASMYLDSLGIGLDNLNTTSQITTGTETTSSVEDLIGQFFTVLALGTPGNDIISGEPGTDLQIARTGSDRLFGVNPGDAIPGQGQFDILIGGPEVSLTGSNPNTPVNNVFILGDRNNPYYAGKTGNLGIGDFALIADFKPNNDVIRLNGTSRNYSLRRFDVASNGLSGTAIFRNDLNSLPDLIALLPGVSDLSLNENYFEYDNTPPPNEIVPKVQQIGTSGVEQAFDIDSDSSSNIYVTGNTTGDIGGSNAGSKDGFIMKYDSAGNQIWSRQIGTDGTDNLFSIKTDINNNIYVTGFTSGTLEGTSAGGDDAFLTKFDSTGKQIWVRQFGTPSLDTAFDVATDLADNIYIAGYTTGDLGGPNANNGSLITSLLSTDDSYVSKFDSDGNQQWIQQFGSPSYDEAYGITTDRFGNVFATGFTAGDLGGTNAGLYDAWIAKLFGDGTIAWIQQFGSEGYEFAWDAATDSFGNVYSVGFTTGNLGGTNAGFYDVFLAKYDTDGNQQWIQQLGTAGSETAFGLDIDEKDRIFLTGFTTGTLGEKNFGGDSAGADDAFWAMFDVNGNLLKLDQLGTSGVDRSFGVNVRDGRIALAGFTDGSFGAPNQGSFDAFVTFKDTKSQQVPEPSGVLSLLAFTAFLWKRKALKP